MTTESSSTKGFSVILDTHMERGSDRCVIFISGSFFSRNTGTARTTVRIEFINDDPPEVAATSKTADFTEDGHPVEFAPDIVITDPDRRCNTSLLHGLQFKVHNHDGLNHEIIAVDSVSLLCLGTKVMNSRMFLIP